MRLNFTLKRVIKVQRGSRVIAVLFNLGAKREADLFAEGKASKRNRL
jgi:hypothetical protein